MTDTIIDLIRHGEPEGGRAYRGHSIDDPLSEKGWQQMWDAIGDNAPWDQIITSPMERCQAFAEALMDTYDIPCDTEDNFKEVGFGNWEGKTPDEIISDNKKEYNDFYNDPVNKRPAGAEPLDQFISRVTDSFNNIIHKHKGKHILIVSHAGVMRAIIAHALHCEPLGLYRIKVNNAGMSRIKNSGKENYLLYHNTTLTDMDSKC